MVKKYACEICKQSFTSSRLWLTHTAQPGSQCLVCHHCHQGFEDSFDLTRHVRRTHGAPVKSYSRSKPAANASSTNITVYNSVGNRKSGDGTTPMPSKDVKVAEQQKVLKLIGVNTNNKEDRLHDSYTAKENLVKQAWNVPQLSSTVNSPVVHNESIITHETVKLERLESYNEVTNRETGFGLYAKHQRQDFEQGQLPPGTHETVKVELLESYNEVTNPETGFGLYAKNRRQDFEQGQLPPGTVPMKNEPELTGIVNNPADQCQLKQEITLTVKEPNVKFDDESEVTKENAFNNDAKGLEEYICWKVEPQDIEVDEDVGLEAARAELYENHTVKDEFELGPEVLQSLDVVYAIKGQALLSKLPEMTTYKALEEKPVGWINGGNIVKLPETSIPSILELTDVSASSHNSSQSKSTNTNIYKHNELVAIAIATPNHNLLQPLKTKINKDKSTSIYEFDHCEDLKSVLKKHKRTHLARSCKIQFCCDFCKTTLAGEQLLMKHMKNAHHVKKVISHSDLSQNFFKCISCDYKCKLKRSMIRHLKNHSKKSFKCTYCQYKNSHKGTWLSHMKRHTRDMPFQCDHCDYQSLVKSSLIHHIRTHTQPFKCSQCDYACAQQINLRNHEKKHGTLIKCSHCNVRFSRMKYLAEHQNIHNKPFKCETCGIKFSRNRDLARHQVTHTEKIPFKCSHCDYTSVRKCNVICHQLVHSGDQLLHCSYCDYVTTYRMELNIHARVHTGYYSLPLSGYYQKPSRKEV